MAESGGRRIGRAWVLAVVAAGCMASTACNRRLLGVLLDLPEASAASGAGGQPAGAVAPAPSMPTLLPAYLLAQQDTAVPAIERVLVADSVLALLPRDHAGNVDWVAAMREEIIRPRHGIGGARSTPPGAFEFKFDFYFPGPNETFDAYFPHSVHTELIDCAQCHPRIFKRRGTEIKMADVLQGRFCGECHGKVAFAPATACERCHTAMTLPADRAKPELIGTVQMRRATEILAELGDTLETVEGNATGVRTDDFPRARFPHWVHRIRYRCKTCHMALFEPRGGTNVVTMVDIQDGRACGKCHNGDTAFPPTISNCARCHPVPPAAAPSAGTHP